MKVFVSHQCDDTVLAGKVAARLWNIHRIESYLDAIDPVASSTGDLLGEHIRSQLGSCTQLLAVVSTSTKSSWWVPWEIGIATEKDQPIATYAGDATALPEYLRKWPYLTSIEDLDEYAQVSKATMQRHVRRDSYTADAPFGNGTADFYRVLRARLGQ